MKTPKVKKFKAVLFCNVYRDECSKTRGKCNGSCEQCKKSEEIYQMRRI